MSVLAVPEQVTDITGGYVPCGDEVIDSQIKDAVVEYYADLQNDKRVEYRQVGIKERLAITCWEWGQSPDPEVQARSRDLKTKQLIRSMARVILSGDPEQTETKHIATLDTYWKEVDEKLRDEIVEFTRRQSGVVVPHHLEFIGDSENVYESLAEIEDFSIYGRFLIRGGVYIHAEYLAQHNSLPVGE